MHIELLEDAPDSLGGYKKGQTIEVADETGNKWVKAGKAKITNSPGNDGGSADGNLEKVADIFAKALEKQGIGKSQIERPQVISRLGSFGGFAEAKESNRFGEWLQALYFSNVTDNPTVQAKGVNILHGKYNTKVNHKFASEFEQGVKNYADATNAIHGGIETKASAQSETVGALGGFAVPVEFSAQLFQLVGEASFLLEKVSKYPMTALEMLIPAVDYSQGGGGKSPYIGGMIAGWSAEGAQFTQSNALLRQVHLKANLLAGYTVASRQLLADNKVGLERVLTSLMAKTIAYYVEYGILNGTGANQPTGILNSACTILASRTGDASNGTLLADLGTMYGNLIPEADGRAFWIVSPSMKSKLIQMNDKSGRVVYMPYFPGPDDGPATRAMPLRIFGLPVFVSQLAGSSGSKGDIFLVDPEGYAFGSRQEIEIGVSEHVNWLTNQLTYRFLFRGDGQPLVNTYLTLQNGDTVSPFVARNT